MGGLLFGYELGVVSQVLGMLSFKVKFGAVQYNNVQLDLITGILIYNQRSPINGIFRDPTINI
jgi:hypothetical protein